MVAGGGYRTGFVRQQRRSNVAFRQQRQSKPYYQKVSYRQPSLANDVMPVAPDLPRSVGKTRRTVARQVQNAPVRQRSLPFKGAEQYGVEGTITASEANTLRYIDFSKGQTYHDLKSRIGFPKYRNGNTDYYEAANGYLAIDYKDGKAYGHRAVR